MVKLNIKYFVSTLLLLSILVMIAVFVKDSFIRPFIGDVLVVIWMYLALKSFLNLNYKTAALLVLAFACTIEILQYFELVKVLGIQNNKVARIVIGSTFDWFDFVAYWLGYFLILIVERSQVKYKDA